MLERFITSKTKRKLLRLFILQPEKRFYVREIERLTGEPIAAVRRELKHLEEAGFLKSTTEGKLKYFQVNKDFPIYPELKRIVYSTIGFGDHLRERMSDLSSIYLAFIYGSVARNDESPQSDVDVLVVGDIDSKSFHNVITEIERETRREINYTLMSKEEFEQRLKDGDSFLKRILGEDKILLKGNVDGCRRTG